MPRVSKNKDIEIETKESFNVDAVEEKEEKRISRSKIKTFGQSDPISCYSVIEGPVYMSGVKTNNLYTFADNGDVEDIEYQDLAAAVRSKSSFIFNPWIVINDDDFIAEFPQLKDFYDNQFSKKDLASILLLPQNEMVANINKLPKTALDSLKVIAASMVRNGSIDSLKKIKFLDETLGTELNLMDEAMN